jgi:RNA polymerase sigma factor (sigma-70 family)
MRGRGGSVTERPAIAAPVEQASIDLGARLAVDRQGAIGEIYAALGATVLSYLQRLVGRDDAEDVLQRVFYEVWRHNGRYDPSRSLAGWVLGIARNRAIDHLRRQRNTAVALETLADLPGADGRELAERYARSHEVRSALTRLPVEQREVLVLAYFGGYTQSQIATSLGLPLGTVKARAFRGLRHLAKLLIP